MRYEYVCDKHGVFEVWQGMNEPHRASCPRCHQEARRKFGVVPHKFDFRDGWDPGLGEYVDTKRDRERYVREKGLTRHEKPDEGRWV
jgi:putative FmdB family regulatory protein